MRRGSPTRSSSWPARSPLRARSAWRSALRGWSRADSAGEALLREALATLEHADARLERARALADLGALLRRSNRRREAREFLREALDVAHRAGARPLAARAETELRATGARPRRVMLAGVESLTASERRVAELAGEGLTNREIAQSLFVTARTVEGHLTNVFRKLDLESRDQLRGAIAARSVRVAGGRSGGCPRCEPDPLKSRLASSPELDWSRQRSDLLTNTCATARLVFLRPRPDRHPAARGDDRREPAPHGRALRGPRRAGRPAPGLPRHLRRAVGAGRAGRPRADRERRAARRSRRHLGAEPLRVGRRAVRDRAGRRDPGHDQSRLQGRRARVRAAQGRREPAGDGAGLPAGRLRRDARRGVAGVPGAAAW